jgi:hypothetical protein
VSSSRSDTQRRLANVEAMLEMERQARAQEMNRRESAEKELLHMMSTIREMLAQTPQPSHGSSRGDSRSNKTDDTKNNSSSSSFGSSPGQFKPLTGRSVRTRFTRDYQGNLLFTDKFLDPFVPDV